MTLRIRLGMLRGVYADVMPCRDPHTAGPALWTLRQQEGAPFEVPLVPMKGTTPWRKGLEAVALSLYRQRHGKSPTVNFGRMPAGYRMSSANNQRLAVTGLRLRGGSAERADASHEPGIAPQGPLEGDPCTPDWGGHQWSAWVASAEAVPALRAGAMGLYRFRRRGAADLLYVGQGAVRAHLVAHLAKARQSEHRQGPLFDDGLNLECSYVLSTTWQRHQRLELQNDLNAGHVLILGAVPEAQFLG